MIGVGVTVGVGVLDGVAGIGVRVARRVAVGLGVSLGMTGISTRAVGVGGSSSRPQPLSSKLPKVARQKANTVLPILLPARWLTLCQSLSQLHRFPALQKGPQHQRRENCSPGEGESQRCSQPFGIPGA